MATHTSESNPIYVEMIESDQWPQGYGKIGMTFAPGKVQEHSMKGFSWKRDLDMDLARLHSEYHTHALVSLMRDNDYKITEIFDKAKEHGIIPVKYPITDGGVPESEEEALPLIKEIVGYLHDGKNVVVHCLGGLGRTGLIVACVVIYILKMDPKECIALVRKARKGTIQTARQVIYVESFAKYLSSL